MKKLRRLTGLVLVSLLIGGMLGSCIRNDFDIESGSGDENGTGFLALGIGINGVGDMSTRAPDPSYNHPGEYALNSLRIILYDNVTELALDVADYYNIQYTGDRKSVV